MTYFVEPAVLARPQRHIFLSPHYDDIALSCGGVAALIARSGRQPEVALIFGDHPDPSQPMTPFADDLHQRWGMSADDVIASRRGEEAVASEILGTTARFLPFRDAIYRGERYLGDPDLFGTPTPDEAATLPGEIIRELKLPHVADGSARIYAPLGIGHHVDHQLAYAAGQALAASGWEVWFYEDLPYGLLKEKVDARVTSVGDAAQPGPLVDVADVWRAKIDAIFAYPSQIKVIFGSYVGVGSSREAVDGAMAAYAREVGGGTLAERFWVSTGTR